MRIEFIHNDVLNVFRVGKTSNTKIAPIGDIVLQSYTYDRKQFNYVKGLMVNNSASKMVDFFALANDNCLDCPFSTVNGLGGCYTHKPTQYKGFLSSMKSIINKYSDFDNIPNYSDAIGNDIIKLVDKTTKKFVRFGSYGEPVLHPITLVESLAKKAKNFTGYTHQWRKPEYTNFNEFFMSSTHNKEQIDQAGKLNFRSFFAVLDENDRTNDYIACNGSAEKNYKTNCSICGLCNGTTAKTKKSIMIDEH